MKILTKALAVVFLLVSTLAIAGGEQPQYLRKQFPQQTQQQITTVAPTINGYISRAIVTTRIQDREPVSELFRIETDFDSVFFFTEIMECTECNFEHQWWFNGVQQYAAQGIAKFPRYRWWSRKELTENDVGDWTVKILLDGRVHKEVTFTYFQPTQTEQKTADIQQRIEVETADECERQLKYYRDELAKAPEDLYIQFMYKKWYNRCLSEIE